MPLPGIALLAGRIVEPVPGEDECLAHRRHGCVTRIVIAIHAETGGLSGGADRQRRNSEQQSTEIHNQAHPSNIARAGASGTPQHNRAAGNSLARLTIAEC